MKRIQKIKEVCTISGGYAFKSNDFTRQGIPIIRIGDISGNKVNISSGTVFFEEYNEKLNKFIIEKGDILVALSGATTGKFGIYDEEIQALLNQRVAKISPKENINNKYLYYYMNKLQNIIYNKALGCAQPNISPNEIGEIEIYVPSRLEQDKISDVLDIAKDLIDKRKKQIEELDLLVKSKFTEMFGDVFLNTKNFEMKQIKDIVTVVKGITYKPNQVNEEGTIVLRSSNIKGSKFDLNDIVRVNKKIDEKFLVEVNDILMCNRNGSERLVGKVAKIPEYNEPMTFGTFMTIIRSPYYNYLFTFFQTEAFRRQIKMQTSVAINQISIPLLESVKVPLPPIELQNQFADFVKQVDKLKFEMEKSLKELEENFNSLMQKIFKVELL
ncbi:TPA: hypothetical protein I9065_002187 [Clostridium perfringens]|nr:hypothetical protein [Clostridium perfringens]